MNIYYVRITVTVIKLLSIQVLMVNSMLMNSRWTRTRGELELMHAGAPEATCGGGAAFYGGHFIIMSLVKIVSTKLLK
jgi:hypothetical protein